jgi:RNA polymerase sigma factor (TIGR02999 family)
MMDGPWSDRGRTVRAEVTFPPIFPSAINAGSRARRRSPLPKTPWFAGFPKDEATSTDLFWRNAGEFGNRRSLSDVTRILGEIQRGDPKGADELLPLVYAELRKLAAYKMAHSAAGHTLQPTALVHDVWLRLVGSDNPTFENRAHFFAAAAEAMRHLLIDNARRKLARRHGGGLQRVDFENVDLAMPADEDHLLAVNDALDQLAARSPAEAQVVKLRFFVGMTVAESAEVLGLSERTVKQYWSHAKTWLYREIQSKKA